MPWTKPCDNPWLNNFGSQYMDSRVLNGSLDGKAQHAMSIITLVGPIDYWWNENWLSEKHVQYMFWRENISKQLVEAGHLVYRPHEAFKGAWNERMQSVNREALHQSDVVINLRPEGVPAHGTEGELEFVQELINNNYPITILEAPPGDYSKIAHLLKRLENPYSDVHRKSYSKEKV